jgi:hypothetical protein
LGIGNRLHLLDDEILANLGDIQLRNGLRPSASLSFLPVGFALRSTVSGEQLYFLAICLTFNPALSSAATCSLVMLALGLPRPDILASRGIHQANLSVGPASTGGFGSISVWGSV